jgi:NAD/NADP transhydrogenase alpha subunit
MTKLKISKMTKLDETIAEFRQKLTDQGVTFFIVYSVKNFLTDNIDTRISSNSTQFGIRAILGAILRPTEQAIELVAHELEAGARAAAAGKATTDAIDKAKDDGAFLAAAKILFEQLRPFYTIMGWETEKPQQQS